MTTVTQPIRHEHKGLLPHIESLKQTAIAVGEVPNSELAKLVDANINFLQHHLVPHATAEEKVLYPAVGLIMGAPAATQTMSQDHVAVVELTERLATLGNSVDDHDDLREVLYGLYTLIKVHFDKEEGVYLTLLDETLSPPEAVELFTRMEHAGHHGH